MKLESMRCGAITVPFALLADSEGKKPAPTELRLVPWGQFDSTKGTFYLDDMGAQSCLQLAKKLSQGRQHFDYEHGAFKKAAEGEFSPSGGTYTLELRSGENGGLWATNIRWTDKAKKAIEDEEILSLSPALVTDDTGRVIGVLNCALTNSPSIFDMPPILASVLAEMFGTTAPSPAPAPPSTPGDTMTTPKYLVLLGIAANTPPDQIEALATQAVGRLSTMQTILLSSIGLPTTATEEQAKTALEKLKADAGTGSALRTQLLSLFPGATTDADVVGKVGAAVAAQQKVTLLSDEVAKLKGDALKTEMEGLVAQGERDGKLTPKMKEWALGLTTKGAEGKATLLSFLEAAPTHPVATPPAGGGTPPGKGKPVVTETARRVARAFGHDPEKVAEHAEKNQ